MEKDKWGNIVAAAVLIAVGLLSLGLTLRNGIVHFKDSDRIVNVKGLSEMEVNAHYELKNCCSVIASVLNSVLTKVAMVTK